MRALDSRSTAIMAAITAATKIGGAAIGAKSNEEVALKLFTYRKRCHRKFNPELRRKRRKMAQASRARNR